jgi:hypothetical protein
LTRSAIPAWTPQRWYRKASSQDLIQSARMLALAFAGKPDEEVRPDLEGVIANVEAAMIENGIDARQTAAFVDIFRRAVMGHKHQVEAAASSGSLSEFLEALRQ